MLNILESVSSVIQMHVQGYCTAGNFNKSLYASIPPQ